MKTFIIRDYPDLDHIFPLINIFVEKNKKVNVLNFEINLNLDDDPRIKYLLENYAENINLVEIYKLKGERIFLDKILNILASEKYKYVNFKNINNLKNKNNLIVFYYLFFVCFLKKLIFSANSFYGKIFFNHRWAENMIKKLNITSVVMDDSYYLNFSRPQSLIKTCITKGIKITIVPHTCFMFTRIEDTRNLRSKNLKNLYANLIVTSDKIKKIFNSCGIENEKIINLGSARFSKDNINLLEKIYGTKKGYDKNLKKNKLNILYIDGAYDIRDKKIELIHEISQLNKFNFKVKAHPRGLFQFDKVNEKEKKFKKNKNTSFLMDISTPTKKLIEESDIIIGTYSSALIDAIIFKKKLLFPKFLLNKESKFEIFYESYNVANSFLNLNDMLKFLTNIDEVQFTKFIDEYDTDIFLRDYVYGGKKNSDEILNNYFKFLEVN